jgi:hypothetical protein
MRVTDCLQKSREISDIADQTLGLDFLAETLKTVKKILEGETGEQSRYRLLRNMIKDSLDYESRFDETLGYLERLRRGLSEIVK